jgi:hypothetical protein
MAVDDRKVLSLIDDYEGRFMSARDPLEKARLAFRAIQSFRNGSGDSADEALAAAEHYLFGKYMVSNGVCSERQMEVMVLGYDGVKAVMQTTDRTEKMMRHNPDRPTSNVSASSVSWGLRGVEDGEQLRLQHNPGQKVPSWNWDAMKFGGVTDTIAEMGKRVY